MEFFNQNKQNQRNIERFVLIFYSIYCLNLCCGAFRMRWPAWIPVFMIAALVVSWIVYIGKYKNYRTRANFTVSMMQLTIILYAANLDDMFEVIPTFMIMTILVAFYGLAESLWVTVASAVFVAFYHGVITDTFALASRGTLFQLLPQVGNLFCMEFIVFAWVRKQNEGNEQVYKIIEALMDAEQSKDDFLSNVSHEIRTPVNTICGMSEMALREQDLEKMREEVFDIQDAGRNLMTLVSDILDFSQLQQGKMNIEEEAYNITSTVNDIINTAMARKGDKNIELIVDCAADMPSGLLGDEKKIRRVIMNLVDNAIKFTNEGCVSIIINARKENYGINLCVSVRDTGIGMREESMEKLFESFSQVDTRRSRQEGGVGLGLAISKALVQKMGGTITVQSRLGKGSILRFVVPQKILKEEPIVQVENREKLNVATYIDMEQFNMTTIRDEYSNNIFHMVQQLQVKYHVCRNLAELKRREALEEFSHIFISMVEYKEDKAYFDELARRTKLILVIDRFDEKHITNPDLLRMYKPFYILPVVSILNGSRGSEGGKQMIRQAKFTAPGVHVLVVDDNQMNIRVIEGLLKEYQIKVTSAASGQEALEVIENMSYDFVFMDHMMPEMDGIETMHRIRDKVGHYYQKVPIIALTANAAPGNREMFLEEGFDDFVAKPVEISVLERVLKRNLPEEKLIYQAKSRPGASQGREMADQKGNLDGKREIYPEKTDEQDLVIGDLDVHKGLLYCGGRQQYLDILEVCCEEGLQNRQLLEGLYEKRDWKNYTIKIHALKSTMLSIGAIPLSERARELETAGKKGDIDFILKHHEELLLEHRRVMEVLAQCPLIHPKLSEAVPEEKKEAVGQKDSNEPELDEETFDELLKELEDAMYSLDGERMLVVLSKMQEYQYCQTALRDRLAPVRTKVEMSDYMSAIDTVNQIRDSIRNEKEGGAAKC